MRVRQISTLATDKLLSVTGGVGGGVHVMVLVRKDLPKRSLRQQTCLSPIQGYCVMNVL